MKLIIIVFSLLILTLLPFTISWLNWAIKPEDKSNKNLVRVTLSIDEDVIEYMIKDQLRLYSDDKRHDKLSDIINKILTKHYDGKFRIHI